MSHDAPRTPPGTGGDGSAQTAAHPWTPRSGGPAVVISFDPPYPPRLPIGHRFPAGLVPAPLRPAASIPAAPHPHGRRRVLLGTLIAATAVLAVVAVTLARAASGPSPRDLVTAFFAALTAHDLPTTACSDSPLCEPDAFRTGYQPPQDVVVGDDTGSADNRQVPVTYTLDGARVSTSVAVLAHQRGSLAGPGWSIAVPPGTQLIGPDQTPATISVAAAQLPTPGTDPPRSFWAPPGRYTITRPATALLDPAQSTVTVTVATPQPIPITVAATLHTGTAATIEQLIRDRIDTCAAETDYTPTVGPPPTWHSCPFSYEDRHTISDNPTWTISSYPHLQLEPADDGSITVTTTTPGTATIHYRWTTKIIEPRTWTDVTDTTDITVSGHIVTQSGTTEWQPA